MESNPHDETPIDHTCPKCGGLGYVIVGVEQINLTIWSPCRTCKVTGYV